MLVSQAISRVRTEQPNPQPRLVGTGFQVTQKPVGLSISMSYRDGLTVDY
ncbi:hypothetical protein CH063_14066 [Colletotrichum higginsianum]|uniref:Uncharacterized protein n=1 Tax=Colletotrichum higginsianum (strain IMI 349063) TaxID=759273 RepID=H1VX14_COLHI|nr:hypothetical protein CH063_14066 [Colletotrichum higginsianum]